MWDFLIFITLVCALGFYIQPKSSDIGAESGYARLSKKTAMLIIYISFILFVGLRQYYNDTTLYEEYFPLRDPKIGWNLKDAINFSYYGFYMFQKYIKIYFNNNVRWLFMWTSIITNIAFITFYKKYSKTFGLTLFCFIIIEPFLLTCAATKQVLAMSISIIGINALLTKKNYAAFYASLLVAYTFHPYIIVLGIAPLLMDDKIWTRKMKIIVFSAIIGSLLFSRLIGVFLNMTEGMNKTYSAEELLDHTISPLRVIVDWMPVIMSYVFRDRINEKNDKIMCFGINMTIVSAIFAFASLFGNPIYIYRMGNYFGIMKAIVIPWMLVECMPKTRDRTVVILIVFILYFVVFFYDVSSFRLTYDPFKHYPISILFG